MSKNQAHVVNHRDKQTVLKAIQDLDRPYFKSRDLNISMNNSKISYVCRELSEVDQWNRGSDPIIWRVVE